MKRKKGTRELKEELESRKKFSIEREYEIQKIIEECEEAKRKLSEIDSLIKEQKNEKKRLAGTESLISNILDRK